MVEDWGSAGALDGWVDQVAVRSGCKSCVGYLSRLFKL